MSDIYSTLNVSPRKKRCPPERSDDSVATPKKLRTTAHPFTPPTTVSRKGGKVNRDPLPNQLARLNTIQIALQHALTHALATCAVSPSSDGIVRNVLNHLSLTTYAGLTTQFDVDDLKRLCWIWEWDGKSLPTKAKGSDEDDNPFLEPQMEAQPKDWMRGSMGIIVSPATHHSKAAGKRVPAYGIGIDVEIDIDKDMGGGMAAVARWTAGADHRRKEFRTKLDRWIELHKNVSPMPSVPLADLPQISVTPKASNLTRVLASASPRGSLSLSLPAPPSSPSRSPSKSPTKRSAGLRDIAVPFPNTPSKRSAVHTQNAIAFPQTPYSKRIEIDPAATLLTPRTPSNSFSTPTSSELSTPVHQRGPTASTAPETPSTSRRQALYERVRQRSLTASPTKSASRDVLGGRLTKDQMLKMGQEEVRRRCLLGRLGGVAESVWMLFSTPASSVAGSTPTSRKRRVMLASEVATAVVKSSPVPISTAEANESLSILTGLCPFFLKPLTIAGEEWLEMPAASVTVDSSFADVAIAGKPGVAPLSPGHIKRKGDSAEELVKRSPRRVKREVGGLREVREIIRRELEIQD